MKNLPACKTCVSSGFLCTSCQEKLDTEVLTQFELDLAKDLLVLEEEDQFSFLKNISFYKAIDFEDVVIFVIGKKDKLKITPKLINWFKETYQVDELLLVEQTKNSRAALESLIAPSKLITLNEIFLATGDIEFKGVLNEKDREALLFTKEELEELILELTGNTIRIEFQ